MGEIVHHDDALPLAYNFLAPLDALKTLDPFFDRVSRQPQPRGQTDHAEGIHQIMPTNHRASERAQIPPIVHHTKGDAFGIEPHLIGMPPR